MFLIIFLVLFPVLSQGEVSTFSRCAIFFFNGNPPTIFRNNNRYKQICQCLQSQPGFYYATFYDTTNRIPVYSAYLFDHGNTNRSQSWKIEPEYNYYHYVSCCLQLDGFPGRCMRGGLRGIGQNQAKNTDYANPMTVNNYDKGHLYPVRHTSTEDKMKATFTLTNAAPQDRTFNRGHWSRHEENLVNILKACPQAFVVTGVVPGAQTINNRVRVAAFYWSAYCCNNNGQLTSDGFIGPDQNGRVQNMPVQNLENILSDQNHYNLPFSVFQGNC
uniref:Uncharacterized protein n=1 Tax=Myripristis murdjan TaxID=586833 RepID=A0A667Z5P0_9TELE